MVAIKATFDGKVFVPDERTTSFETGQHFVLHVEEAQSASGRKRYMTGAELARSEFVGMWEHREDLRRKDSVEFVNELRNKIERREL